MVTSKPSPKSPSPCSSPRAKPAAHPSLREQQRVLAGLGPAVAAARRAFETGPWSRMSPSERGRVIWRIGDLILEHAEELAQLESLDNGKPYAVAAAADVPLAADLFHFMAGWATKIEGNTINISVPYMPGANFHSYTLREPIGVVGQIIPWNFPLLMAAWKLGPAHLKKLTLELGGKSPNIVFEDAQDDAVAGAANAIFFNHGQCCVAGSRLFVHQSRFDEVVDGVSEIAKSIKVGPGLDPTTQMGPLVSEEQFRRVTGYLESGKNDGATAVTGGGRVGDKGYFVEPTVITNTNPSMSIVREEIFGPVVVAAPFQDLDEIAAAANDSEYGHCASRSLRAAMRAAFPPRSLALLRRAASLVGKTAPRPCARWPASPARRAGVARRETAPRPSASLGPAPPARLSSANPGSAAGSGPRGGRQRRAGQPGYG
ncbi:MAG TPA: aldehyde dehydrogenase family protein [Streptosporangiaceae bacterium]|nr:aldehyde dehydrogenase family protein [Streptosporangiaceae bacterium]